jgi:hypothetical protein
MIDGALNFGGRGDEFGFAVRVGIGKEVGVGGGWLVGLRLRFGGGARALARGFSRGRVLSSHCLVVGIVARCLLPTLRAYISFRMPISRALVIVCSITTRCASPRLVAHPQTRNLPPTAHCIDLWSKRFLQRANIRVGFLSHTPPTRPSDTILVLVLSASGTSYCGLGFALATAVIILESRDELARLKIGRSDGSPSCAVVALVGIAQGSKLETKEWSASPKVDREWDRRFRAFEVASVASSAGNRACHCACVRSTV